MNRFLSPASFQTPLWLVESAWIEHGPFAFWIADQLRPRLTVELGSYRGYSFAAFCQATTDRTDPWKALAIDSWEGDKHSGFFKSKGDEFHAKLDAHLRQHYPGKTELKRMYFSQALSAVADGSVDLLHIDGRHTYEDVKEDHTSWLPKLSDRAMVMFHDTQVRVMDFGVWRYWEEISAGRPSFEFHHGNGLGILAHRNTDVSALSLLLSPELAEDTRQQIRTAYHRLGAGIAAQQKADKFDAYKARRKRPVRHVLSQLIRR